MTCMAGFTLGKILALFGNAPKLLHSFSKKIYLKGKGYNVASIFFTFVFMQSCLHLSQILHSLVKAGYFRFVQFVVTSFNPCVIVVSQEVEISAT